MDGWNTSFLLGWPIFRCYVSFREGNNQQFYSVGSQRASDSPELFSRWCFWCQRHSSLWWKQWSLPSEICETLWNLGELKNAWCKTSQSEGIEKFEDLAWGISRNHQFSWRDHPELGVDGCVFAHGGKVGTGCRNFPCIDFRKQFVAGTHRCRRNVCVCASGFHPPERKDEWITNRLLLLHWHGNGSLDDLCSPKPKARSCNFHWARSRSSWQ